MPTETLEHAEAAPHSPAETSDACRDATRTLTLAAHLEELRRRLGVSLAALVATTAVMATQAGRLVEWLRRPAGEALPAFAFFSPAEGFVAYVKVALLAGIAAAMPVVLWQAWAFIRPGLAPRERQLGRTFVTWGTGLFLLGAAFAYALVLPPALRVLLTIGAGQLTPIISVDRYVGFVTTLLLWCGVAFELPAVVWLLAAVGLVTPAWLRQQRPYALLVLVIVAAVVTPTTDPVNLALLLVPLAALYELSIWLSALVVRRRAAANSREG